MPKFKILERERKEEILEFFNKTFGIEKEIFEDYVFLSSGKKVWLAKKETWEKINDLKKINVQSVGISCLRISKTFKPTTNFLQLFGKYAKKNVIVLNEEEAYDFIRGLDIKKECKEKGFVIVKFGNDILGCGLVKGEWIKNQIPKARRIKKF